MNSFFPLASKVGTQLLEKGWTLVTAESCTGGGIAYAVTTVPGSSQWYDRGFITYSNASKTAELGVHEKMIAKHGAVSSEVAAAMAKGALRASKAGIAISSTGIAGPDGGSATKPIGTVCFGLATEETTLTERCHFTGDRDAIRQQSILHALQMLSGYLHK